MYHRNLKAGLVQDGLGALKASYILNGSWKKCWLAERGLTALTYALNLKISKQLGASADNIKTLHLHLTNILIHVLNTGLTACILQALGLNPLWGTLYFLVTPLAVNSVADVSGRAGMLGYTFSALALIAALTGWHIVVPFLLLLAYKSKEDSLMVVPLIMAMLLYLGSAAFIIYLLVLISTVLVFGKRISKALDKPSITHKSGMPPPLTEGAWIRTFTFESVRRWPQWFGGWGYSINPDVEETSWNRFGIALLCLLITMFMLAASGIPWVMLAMMAWWLSPWWAYVAVKPLPDVILEHRAYQSILGLSIAVAGASTFIPTWILASWLTYLACVTRERAGFWKPGVLYEHAYLDGSHKPLILLNLASAYASLGRLPEAEAIVKNVLKDIPNAFMGWAILANIYAMRGQPRVAYMYQQRAALRCPEFPMAWELLGERAESMYRRDRAMAAYRKAAMLTLAPKNHKYIRKLIALGIEKRLISMV
jgi:hypothetical protein